MKLQKKMRFISEHIAVIDSTKEVAFVRRQPDFHEEVHVENWVEVDDLEAWIAAFFDKVRDIASTHNAGSFFIEKTAFDSIT